MHTTREAAINFIKDRLKDLGLTPRAVSLLLDKGPTYLADYMGEKASPKALDEETRRDLAKILDVDEENLKFQRQKVNTSVGKAPHNVRTSDIGRSGRRDTSMSLGDVYTRIGKLEHRLELLEAQQRQEPPDKDKKPSRPS